ncbi:hypothetical protein D6833_09195 [Candidatus Parcubacteria bacterium]|nr:MAG: hypothetical protein D6833_09195 [Candidatus Parcubacteria bacterium]
MLETTVTSIYTNVEDYRDAIVSKFPRKHAPKALGAPFGISATPITFMAGEIRIKGDPLLGSQPKTPIAKALLEARRAYIESGGPLLDWNEIEAEVARLRGGLEKG